MSAFEGGPEDVDESGGSRSEVLSTYTLQVIGPQLSRVFHLRPDFLRETEENLTDLLPDGYRVEIKEWDA